MSSGFLRGGRPGGSSGSGSLLERVTRFAREDVWQLEVERLGRVRGALTRLARVVLISGRGFVHDRVLQQAAALTYLTIFALPAFLALVFSVAKGFGAFARLRQGPIDGFLDRAFPEAGGEGSARIREVVDQIFTYVENADLKVLGTAGVVFLVYATLKMLGSVERSFNEIWGVQRARTLLRKFSDYLGIVIVIPVVLLVATAFTGFLSYARDQGAGQPAAETGTAAPAALEWLRDFLEQLGVLGPLLAALPLLSICLGMTLVLMTLPNTRVRLLPALVGGVVAGVAWQLAQFAFLEFQLGLTRLNAVFSGFAAVPLLLSWIYLSWIVLFLGAELAYAVQNVRAITSIARTGTVDQRFREALAPRLAGRVTAAFLNGERPPDAVSLASELGVSPRAIAGVLEALVHHRLLAETAEGEVEGYLPARDPDTICVLDLLRAMRVDPDTDADGVPTLNALDQRVDRILAGFEEELSRSLHNHTLRELAQALGEPRDDARPAAAADVTRAAENPS